MTYIIVQTVLKKQENKENTVNNLWENIVRRVEEKDRETEIDKDEIDKYKAEDTSGYYDNLLQVTMATVEVH